MHQTGRNIYLEVAKPRALIVIEKATQEAGQISEKVRAFIADSLELRTEVPGLALSNDGSFLGGGKDEVDVLQHVQERKNTGPGVVVGPDSTPTLSFTSGSEWRPKGVEGRHFSLAFYFDWMAKTFHLSEKDKFTMLSGIAHDIPSSGTCSHHCSSAHNFWYHQEMTFRMRGSQSG